MQSTASRLQIDINMLFFNVAMLQMSKAEKRGMGRHIKGRVLAAQAKQKRKGRKVYALHVRGGHW